MTVTDRTAATEQEFAARIAAFESAPTPPEVREVAVLEEVARAIFDVANPITAVVPDYWLRVTGGDMTRNAYRKQAAAAVAAYRATQDGGDGMDCPSDHCGRACEDVIRERDEMEEIADQLAYAVAPVEVIGEHSSMNDPWQNALDLLRERTPLATQDGGAEEAVRRVEAVVTAWEQQLAEPRELLDWQVASKAVRRRMTGAVRDIRAALAPQADR